MKVIVFTNRASYRPYDERCAIAHAHARTRLNSHGCVIDRIFSSSYSPLVKFKEKKISKNAALRG